jgi:branched-chain amino acid transport system permease protein
MTYIDTTTFTVGESILLFSTLIIAGLGRPFGALFASAVLILLPEGLRFLGLPEQMADPTRRVLWGLLLLGLMRFRPEGLLANVNGVRCRPEAGALDSMSNTAGCAPEALK